MIFKFSCFFVFKLLIISALSVKLAAEPLVVTVNAEAAILMNADSGAILYEKNAHSLQYPASITKIATTAYTLKVKGHELNTPITADQDSIGWVTEEAKRRSNYTMPSYLLVPGSSHIGIKKGETLSLQDLLYGMMLASGDDASNVIAQFVGDGSIPKFMEKLNLYIKEIGCTDTVFCNPHGLHHPKQQTTAYDMALLTREALKNPIFQKIISTVRYTRPKTNKQEATTLVQSNKLLRTGQYYYPKAIGVKTGHLSLAQNTFVAAAKDGDRTLIAVLLKVPERKDIFLDSIKMFDAAFNQPKVQRILLKKGPQKFSLSLQGGQKEIKTLVNEELKIAYYPAEEPTVKSLLYWDVLKFPIAKGQKVGELVIETSDGLSKKIPLFAQENVKATWLFWFKSFFLDFKNSSFLKLLGFLAILYFMGFFALKACRRA